ncbi:MAG: HlyC/CorC family transporter [Microthrixaceae bacterium]|nr:HlyC/CorC family transporter [Microthrixaceae bacterium]
MALVSLREGQLQRLEEDSNAGRVLAGLAREPNRFLATIQVGITLAGLLASAAAAVSIAVPLEEPLSFLGGWAEPVAVTLVTLVLAYVTLVFGELAPKRLAMQRAERWGLVAARPLAAMAVVTRPVVWLLSRSTDVAVRLLGGDPDRQREEVTEEELRDLVAAQTTFSDKQRDIIEGAFEVSDRTLRRVLRPRREVFVLSTEAPASQALAALAASGHSRAPVGSGGSLDAVVGVVHLRDLLAAGDGLVGDVTAEVFALPESAPVLDALHQLQVHHHQLAVVVDEHGATSGIVTVEDLVEELVGEIYDESDTDVLSVHRLADGDLVLPGTFPVHDLADLGVEHVPPGPFVTVAGLVLDRLDRIPDAPGDRVDVAGWTFEITAISGRAITEVHLRPAS